MVQKSNVAASQTIGGHMAAHSHTHSVSVLELVSCEGGGVENPVKKKSGKRVENSILKFIY